MVKRSALRDSTRAKITYSAALETLKHLVVLIWDINKDWYIISEFFEDDKYAFINLVVFGMGKYSTRTMNKMFIVRVHYFAYHTTNELSIFPHTIIWTWHINMINVSKCRANYSASTVGLYAYLDIRLTVKTTTQSVIWADTYIHLMNKTTAWSVRRVRYSSLHTAHKT